MQVTASSSLFNVLGGLNAAAPGNATAKPAAARQPQPIPQQTPPARPAAHLQAPPGAAAAPPANLPRGSLLNITV